MRGKRPRGTYTGPGAAIKERERLARGIYQLTAIIESNTRALRSKTTPHGDHAGLQRQIEVRTAERDCPVEQDFPSAFTTVEEDGGLTALLCLAGLSSLCP